MHRILILPDIRLIYCQSRIRLPVCGSGSVKIANNIFFVDPQPPKRGGGEGGSATLLYKTMVIHFHLRQLDLTSVLLSTSSYYHHIILSLFKIYQLVLMLFISSFSRHHLKVSVICSRRRRRLAVAVASWSMACCRPRSRWWPLRGCQPAKRSPRPPVTIVAAAATLWPAGSPPRSTLA